MTNDRSDTRSPVTLELPARLDTAVARELKERLLSHRGARLILNAEAVQHVGGLSLQVLIAARKTWEADGVKLEYAGMSESFFRDIHTLGIEHTRLEN